MRRMNRDFSWVSIPFPRHDAPHARVVERYADRSLVVTGGRIRREARLKAISAGRTGYWGYVQDLPSVSPLRDVVPKGNELRGMRAPEPKRKWAATGIPLAHGSSR